MNEKLLEKVKGLSTKNLLKLTAIVDKMDIREELKNLDINTGDELKDQTEVGKQLILLLISKLYKAENEIYDFIASYKGISREEAENVNAIEIIKEVFSIDGTTDFLS